MRTLQQVAAIAGAGLFSLFCGAARADGLADLKASLTKLQGHAPIKAQVEVKTVSRQGEGKELEEKQGHAIMFVEQGERGVQVRYSNEMLASIEAERRAKEKDPKAKTPTLSAMNHVGMLEMHRLSSSAPGLMREIEGAVFKGEKADVYNGKPARLLNFEFTTDKLPKKEREAIKKFDGGIDVWIAADGTPLGSRARNARSMRMFLVVSFETKDEEDVVYGVVGDRLLTLKKESKNSGAGMGEKGEGKTTTTLQVQA